MNGHFLSQNKQAKSTKQKFDFIMASLAALFLQRRDLYGFIKKGWAQQSEKNLNFPACSWKTMIFFRGVCSLHFICIIHPHLCLSASMKTFNHDFCCAFRNTRVHVKIIKLYCRSIQTLYRMPLPMNNMTYVSLHRLGPKPFTSWLIRLIGRLQSHGFYDARRRWRAASHFPPHEFTIQTHNTYV